MREHEPSIRLLERVVCPHCWHRFAPQDVLFVATHSALIDDPVAGPEAHIRFLPSRFTPEGNAIDPGGAECRELACPRCHLEIPRVLLEIPPMFASIIGAPASGKTYFLAAMLWQLRSILPRMGWSLVDADPLANARVHEAEQSLFLSETPDTPAALAKTATEGADLYRTVRINGNDIRLPRPFQFTISPASKTSRLERVLVLYDNAGEHFLPGGESSGAPITEHLARSNVLMFLLDPTQDPRLRARCASVDPQLSTGPRGKGFSNAGVRQDTILSEVAQRVRRQTGLSQTAKHKAPLIVILAKADLLGPLLPVDLSVEPVTTRNDRFSLNGPVVRRASLACRNLLKDIIPEFVAVAESFSRSVLYMPVSSLGRSPELIDAKAGMLGVRPRDVRPRWVTAPVLAALQSLDPAGFPMAENHAEGVSPQPVAASEAVGE